MREAQAQAVLLVQAVETHDPEGRILPLEERARATDAARTAGGAPDRVLAARADRLLPRLEAAVPEVPVLLRWTRFGAGFAPWIALAAFLVGLLSNALGPHRRIALLQWWLLGLVAYNLVVYVVFLWFERKGHGNDDRPAPIHLDPAARAGDAGSATRGGRAAHLARGVFDRVVGRFVTRVHRRRVGEAAALASAMADYAAAWRRAVLPLLASRARLALHVAAMAMAVGTVLGMYVRGLAFRYEVTWESTFLAAPQMQSVLDVLLGPAGAVLASGVPDVGPLESPRSGPAAPWIHLYALTALLLVVVPRALFVLVESRRARRLAADLPVEVGAAYTLRAGAVTALEGVSAALVPWSYGPAPRARDAAVGLLHEVLGASADVRVLPLLPYGADVGEAPAPSSERRLVVLLASLGQTPETEVHGRLLREVAARAPSGDRWVLLVDAGPLRERLGDGPRIAERRRAWDLVARESGVPVVHADLLSPPTEPVLEALLSAAGPLVVRGRAGGRP